ncbi:hypothetical protein M6B22_20820 [Jatrophihabitans cynanchi]|jgi:hypothetical protein|uniref:Uncharacterized protein n=1 Tax=Jatrophihabitans cynanchi TaxID=2944128 RepID=A0ABY7K0U8_9ACTN|nr:hypothetical protein [Jatrophihabitans sp. SB3-54]WAX56941.1 hypothetical protein M6B22_20820 [Jatrophihabitans sp. SB3-54]
MNDTALRNADPAADLHPDAGSPEAVALLARIVAAPQPRTRGAGRRSPAPAIGRIAIGGLVAGAAAAIAIVAPMPWNQGRSGLGSAAYAVTRDSDGAVHFAVHWSRLTDPAGLQAALDRAGARTRIFVRPASEVPDCPSPSNTVGYSAKAVHWQHPGTADGGFTVRPANFPAGGTFVIGVDLAPSGQSTFAPGEPQLASFSAFMVVGEVPSCVP